MRHSGYKPILVSPDIHRRLADIGRKKETFNEIIADLIDNTIRSEPMLGGWTHPISRAKGVMNPNG